MMPKLSEDKKWEAKSDVDTLISAQEILDDSARRKRALTYIQERNKATDKAEGQLETKTSDRIKKLKQKK